MFVTELLLKRSNISDISVSQREVALDAGEILLQIECFALTANNVTYAAHGVDMAYWGFFPAPEGFGIVPVWGFAGVIESRVDGNALLRGTKHRVATEGDVLVGKGRSDGRTLIFVPEMKGGETIGITLLHVGFHDRLSADVMRSVLQGYDRRYDRLVDWVTETEGTFDDAKLGEFPVEDLLIGPISDTADRWKR